MNDGLITAIKAWSIDPIVPYGLKSVLRKCKAEIERLEKYGIAPPECDDCGELMSERDNAEDTLDAVLDLVLGKDRREWSNLYGFIEAIEDVEGRMVELSAPIFAPPKGYAIVPIITEATPFSCGINGDPPQVDNAWTPPCKVWCGRKQCAAKESP